MVIGKLLIESSKPVKWISETPPATLRDRRKARLYIMMAERHLAQGADASLVAALVRAGWRAHQKADAALDQNPTAPKFGW